MSFFDGLDIATQFYVNLQSNSSSPVTVRIRAGDFTTNNYGETQFTVGLYDFTGKLARLNFTDDFGGFDDSPPAFYVPSGTQLSSIEIVGNPPPSSYLDYSILVTPANGASSVGLIMGFYIWTGDGANLDSTQGGGFTVDLNGYDWSAGATTTCAVQISNSSDNGRKKILSKENGSNGVYVPWFATSKGN